jgi:tRNA (adenine37-N6)-methyltransferase
MWYQHLNEGGGYQVVVAGKLDQRWARLFEGWHLRALDGATALECSCDEAALYGLLSRLRDLGLTLLAVQRSVVISGDAHRRDNGMEITLRAIGTVRAARLAAEDDNWGGTEAQIELADWLPEEALAGLDSFSHAEIIFVFDQVDPTAVVTGARHPRNNRTWPAVGIFAQRAKNRPNRLGLTTVRVLGVSGRVLRVTELDALDGTPVLDIKPVMAEFLPRAPIRQPDWSHELMRRYWHLAGAPKTERENG